MIYGAGYSSATLPYCGMSAYSEPDIPILLTELYICRSTEDYTKIFVLLDRHGFLHCDFRKINLYILG